MRLRRWNGARRGVWLLAGAALVLAVLFAAGNRRSETKPLRLEIRPDRLPADGVSTSVVSADRDVRPALSIVEGARHAMLDGDRLRAGVLPGAVLVEARASGFSPARARIETYLAVSDSARDGTPDFLRLADEADRRAFTGWFTFLAEAQALAKPAGEVTDCAALARFAYREALRAHDGRWAADLNLPGVPATPPVRKYQHPFTPLGPRIFRVAPGSFAAADLDNNAFAEFADAETLLRRNSHFISRDLRRAEPGDLLFFRQPGQRMPFHMMIYVGESRIEPGREVFVVYHTGPDGHGPGEIRRPAVGELLAHPLPQWRPLPANSNFLGVYRWNILKD